MADVSIFLIGAAVGVLIAVIIWEYIDSRK